jgi:hypothetical protein
LDFPDFLFGFPICPNLIVIKRTKVIFLFDRIYLSV